MKDLVTYFKSTFGKFGTGQGEHKNLWDPSYKNAPKVIPWSDCNISEGVNVVHGRNTLFDDDLTPGDLAHLGLEQRPENFDDF